jgi:phosphohistidine phosphatase
MPRYLYLLRHAQSAEKQPGQSDRQRELTRTGRNQAVEVANFFRDQNNSLNLILSSDADRAKTTATVIGEALRLKADQIIFDEKLYEASPRIIFERLSHLDDNLQHVLCVAHNPGISYLAEYLTKAEIGDMAPAGMAIIEFNLESWNEMASGTGDLIRYVENWLANR